MAAMKPEMARKISIDSRKTCGLDRLRGSYSTSSVTSSLPIDRKNAIGAPRFPFATRLWATLNGIVTKLKGTAPQGEFMVQGELP